MKWNEANMNWRTKNQVWDGTFNICHNVVEGVYLLHIIAVINAWYFHCINIAFSYYKFVQHFI